MYISDKYHFIVKRHTTKIFLRATGTELVLANTCTWINFTSCMRTSDFSTHKRPWIFCTDNKTDKIVKRLFELFTKFKSNHLILTLNKHILIHIVQPLPRQPTFVLCSTCVPYNDKHLSQNPVCLDKYTLWRLNVESWLSATCFHLIKVTYLVGQCRPSSTAGWHPNSL